MATIEEFSNLIGKDVFTDKGSYCGKISNLELDLEKFKVRAIVVDVVKGSFLADIIGSKKGVVIPFQMVQSIGEIVIIKSISPSLFEVEKESKETTEII
ncbi:MAG: PRC-barrel domain-containing protein [Candidatus Aenigmatarchaeota archaeon]